jgi:hypothetical protein
VRREGEQRRLKIDADKKIRIDRWDVALVKTNRREEERTRTRNRERDRRQR